MSPDLLQPIQCSPRGCPSSFLRGTASNRKATNVTVDFLLSRSAAGTEPPPQWGTAGAGDSCKLHGGALGKVLWQSGGNQIHSLTPHLLPVPPSSHPHANKARHEQQKEKLLGFKGPGLPLPPVFLTELF